MYVWDSNDWSDTLSLKKPGYLKYPTFEVVRFEKNIIKTVLKKTCNCLSIEGGVPTIVSYGNIQTL